MGEGGGFSESARMMRAGIAKLTGLPPIFKTTIMTKSSDVLLARVWFVLRFWRARTVRCVYWPSRDHTFLSGIARSGLYLAWGFSGVCRFEPVPRLGHRNSPAARIG